MLPVETNVPCCANAPGGNATAEAHSSAIRNDMEDETL